MKIRKPAQDVVFRCLASSCSDTCCAGWEIPVDEESYLRWQQLPSPWREKMTASVQRTAGERQLKQRKGRCVLLNQENLCELYAACGVEALCRTCYWHPRFVAEYGGLREIMPGLSCPAWASLYLMADEPVSFITEETQELPVCNTIDGVLFYHLMKARTEAFALLQNRSVPIVQRMEALLTLAQEADGTQEQAEAFRQPVLPEYLHKLRHLEILTPRWEALLHKPHPSTEQPWREIVAEQLLVYYVFRFWLKGVYRGRVLPWAKLAVWSCVVTAALAADCESREDYVEVIRLYSKEIEHDAENIAAMYRVLCRHSGRYSAAGLLKAWEEIK